MSQNDFDIANQTFPSFRSDLNDALQAAATVSAGATAPTTPYAYQLWYDTANEKYMIRNAANSAWLNFVGIDTNGNVDVTGTVTADGVESTCAAGDANQALLAYHPTSTSARTIAKFQSNVGGTQQDKVVIKCDGNVGIATASPSQKLHVVGQAIISRGTGSAEGLSVGTTSSNTGTNFGTIDINGQAYSALYLRTGNTSRFSIFQAASYTSINTLTAIPLTFGTNDIERMRIDGGNLLVGKTVDDINTTGTNITNYGLVAASRSGGYALALNRSTSDGDIVEFRKDGSTVGSIGVSGGKLTINSQGSNLSYATGGVVRMNNDSSQFYPQTDNSMNLGIGSLRWNTLFASNGTINTSDANEKQQIASLTTAEITAAKAISALFKTYKWNDAVAAKGDAARTHTGVIAQDVEAAMTAAGLDAADYAFWCSDTWWETQTEVPAVEAVEAVLDEDGNVVTEAVEAVAAYTRTDTYETAEEAPEGATERTRLGIRYPELLAFVGAATEQRLANIETRLTALEA